MSRRSGCRRGRAFRRTRAARLTALEATGQRLELGDFALEFCHQWARTASREDGGERPVVPDGICTGIEPLPQGLAYSAVVENDRADVVHLVGQRHPDGRWVSLF